MQIKNILFTIILLAVAVGIWMPKNSMLQTGSVEYNPIYSGALNSRVWVSSTSSTLIMDNNSGRVSAKFCNSPLGGTLYYIVATSSDVGVARVDYGNLLGAGECETFGPDNLFTTAVYGIVEGGASTTVSSIEK